MISAIVLAAGRSRRMGTQKLLLPFPETPLIAQVVDTLLLTPVDEILVVVGADGSPIRRALTNRNVRFVVNEQAEEEMLQSVRCGIRATAAETTGSLIVLGDQPGITADVITGLVQSFHNTTRRIVVPTHQEKRGHPLLVAAHYRDEILTRYDGCGLRGLLDAHPADIQEVEVAAASILEDIDLPVDYQLAMDRLDHDPHDSSTTKDIDP